ncbi:terminase [Mesorhizobium sp. B2-4-14]|uniref:terminase large subunit domain-containing protein n=1 Tax=Mesorhizobium sp. B2-4-14 TaxID=2589935 RepID=UPI00112E753F|nr:terminase family protein [Mesorhizobium sp. B2-4-14]TPL06420.1 terminase [Mesorhizobium sp. B2-4-14]
MSLARDMARAFDPVLMMADYGVTADRWQADVLRQDPRRTLLLCSRQSGKTEVAICKALHTAIYQPPALVVILSPSQRQSGELFRRLMLCHQRLEGAPELIAESALRAELSNGSRILALPGSERTVRGIAGVDLLIADEAARIPDELMTAGRPMMATRPDARMMALTTPAGKRGWFFEAWHGGDTWARVRVPATDCPRISAEFLAEELRELGPTRFGEEYNLEFYDDQEAAFPTAIIDAAFSAEVSPLW